MRGKEGLEDFGFNGGAINQSFFMYLAYSVQYPFSYE